MGQGTVRHTGSPQETHSKACARKREIFSSDENGLHRNLCRHAVSRRSLFRACLSLPLICVARDGQAGTGKCPDKPSGPCPVKVPIRACLCQLLHFAIRCSEGFTHPGTLVGIAEPPLLRLLGPAARQSPDLARSLVPVSGSCLNFSRSSDLPRKAEAGSATAARTSFDSAEVQTIQLTQADLQELFVPWAFPASFVLGQSWACFIALSWARLAWQCCQVIALPVSFSFLFSGADEQAAASASSRERARGLGESECRVAPAQLKASRSRIATNPVPQCISKAISLVLNYWKRMMIEHPFQVLPNSFPCMDAHLPKHIFLSILGTLRVPATSDSRSLDLGKSIV